MAEQLNLLKTGNMFFQQQKFQEAIKSFDNVIKDNPKNADAYFLKANTLKALGLNDQALEMYNQSLKCNPKNVEVSYNKGNLLKSLNRLEEAIKCYDQVIFYNNKHSLAYNNKGNCLITLKKYQDAFDSYLNSVNFDLENFGALYNCGFCLHSMGKYKEAIEYYDKSLKINPEYSNAYFNKGNTHDEMKEYDEAIKCYDLAIKYNSKNIDAFYNKGLCLTKKKDFKSAILNYDQTIKLNPKYDDAYFRKGLCLNQLKEYKQAITTFTQAVDLNPENPSYQSERGVVYLELKQVLNGFNDLNSARKYLQTGKLNELKKEDLNNTKKSVDKMNSIDVVDIMEMMNDKINFLEGNQDIKKEFLKMQPEIKSKFNKTIEKNIEKNIQSLSTSNTGKSSNQEVSKNLMIFDEKINKNFNEENSNYKNNKNINIQINQQKIETKNIININNLINIGKNTEKENNNVNISKDQLNKIYDLIFTLNEKVKIHESKIKKLYKKLDDIEKELENKMNDYRKKLTLELEKYKINKIISDETKNNLILYYNGFNSCFNRFYITAQMIIQDQFKNNQSSVVSICSFLVSLVPIAGHCLSIVTKSVSELLRNLSLKNEAKKFLSLAADCSDLSQKIGSCSLDICRSENKRIIISDITTEQIESLIKSDYNFIENFAKKFEKGINFSLFDAVEKSSFYKYGEYDANCIIRKYLTGKFSPFEDYDKQFSEFIINNKNEKLEKIIKNDENQKVSCGCKSRMCFIF